MNYFDDISDNQEKKNKVYLISSVLFIVLILGLFIYASNTVIKYDKHTLCPNNIDVGTYVILIDTSDKISKHQARFMNKEIAEVIQDAPVYTKFIVSRMDEEIGGISNVLFNMCKPLDGSSMNELYENPTLAKNRFKKKFLIPLNQKINEMTTLSTQSRSPIYESLTDIYSLKLLKNTSDNINILLFSDLLQNSEMYSVYQNQRGVRKLQPINMSTAEIDIFYLQRKGKSNLLQNNVLRDDWISFFKKSKARRIKFKKVRN